MVTISGLLFDPAFPPGLLDSVGRFRLQPANSDHTWQFVWVPAHVESTATVVALVTLDGLGLLRVDEQAEWQATVFTALHALPPAEWGNPWAWQRAQRRH